MGRDEYRIGSLISIVVLLTLLANFTFSSGPGPNNKNFSVDTKVNITASSPFVTRVYPQNPITLNAGTFTNVTCNATILNYGGFGDIATVNATFFYVGVSEFGPPENNTRYFNASCDPISGEQSGMYANYTCTFPLNFYANNGSWACEIRANGTTGLWGNGSNTTTVNALYALNVTPLIDYGKAVTGEYAGNATANITNLGNMNINITVKGYARTINDNLGFVCDNGQLSVDTEHFAANSTASFFTKQTLSGTLARVSGLTVNRSVNATPVTNTTYWEVYIDPAQIAFGNCTGVVIFQAETS